MIFQKIDFGKILTAGVSVFILLAFAGAAIVPAEMPHDLKKDVENAIPAFAEVEPGIYRSSAIPEDVFPFLKAYGIRTIINFDDRAEVAGPEAQKLSYFGIKTYNLPWKSPETPSDEVVNESLSLLADKTLQPVLIHCGNGKDRTGLMVALYRVTAEKWTPDQAYAEMKTNGFREFSYGHLKNYLYDYAYKNFGYEKPKTTTFEKLKTRFSSGVSNLVRFFSAKEN